MPPEPPPGHLTGTDAAPLSSSRYAGDQTSSGFNRPAGFRCMTGPSPGGGYVLTGGRTSTFVSENYVVDASLHGIGCGEVSISF